MTCRPTVCLRMTDINFGNYFTDFTETIAHEEERFQGMFDTIINFTPNKFYVKLLLCIFRDNQ